MVARAAASGSRNKRRTRARCACVRASGMPARAIPATAIPFPRGPDAGRYPLRRAVSRRASAEMLRGRAAGENARVGDRVAPRREIKGSAGPDPRVRAPSHRAAVPRRDPHRLVAFPEEPSLVRHEYAPRVSRLRGHIVAQPVAHDGRIPDRAPRELLAALGGRSARRVGRRPAVLALRCRGTSAASDARVRSRP